MEKALHRDRTGAALLAGLVATVAGCDLSLQPGEARTEKGAVEALLRRLRSGSFESTDWWPERQLPPVELDGDIEDFVLREELDADACPGRPFLGLGGRPGERVFRYEIERRSGAVESWAFACDSSRVSCAKGLGGCTYYFMATSALLLREPCAPELPPSARVPDAATTARARGLVAGLVDGRDDGDEVRALSLMAASAKGARVELAALLDHADPRARRLAVQALVQVRWPESAGALASALDDPDACVRLRAAHGLRVLREHAHSALPMLEAMASTDASPCVQSAARVAIAWIERRPNQQVGCPDSELCRDGL